MERLTIQNAYRTVLFESSGKASFEFVKSDDEVKKILDDAKSYNENERYSRAQFVKYFKDKKKKWYGIFKDGKCRALCVLKHVPNDSETKDIILLAEIQSFTKGYGKRLINKILSEYENVWWAVDKDGGKGLLDFYGQFGLKKKTIAKSKWTKGTQQNFFYKSSDKSHEKKIVSLIDSFDMSGDINESFGNDSIEPLFYDMMDYFDRNGCICSPRPKIVLLDEPQDVLGKTGNYDCDGCIIRIFVSGRHPKDILRTFAHELFHHHQHVVGGREFENLDKDGTIDENPELENVESEAYSNGNVLFRKWCDEKKSLLGRDTVNEDSTRDVDELKFDSDGNGYSVMTKEGTYVAYMDINVGYSDEIASKFSGEIEDFDERCMSFFDPYSLICNIEYIHVEKPFRGLGYAKMIARKALSDITEKRGIWQFLMKVQPDSGTSKEAVVSLAKKIGFTELQDTARDGMIMGLKV